MTLRALRLIPPTLLLGAGLALPATAQTEILHSIERPPGFLSDWGTSFGVLHDLDGDGVPDLAIGTHKHGGGLAASVHSGADGSLLRQFAPPPEMMLSELAPALVLGDVNGDAHDDFLCKVRLDVGCGSSSSSDEKAR